MLGKQALFRILKQENIHTQLNQLSKDIKEIQDALLLFIDSNGDTAQFDKYHPMYNNTLSKSGPLLREVL